MMPRKFAASDIPELENALRVLAEMRGNDLISEIAWNEGKDSILDRIREAKGK